MFEKYILSNNFSYEKLLESYHSDLEDIVIGRQGLILVENANKIPLVRSTTYYNKPACQFNYIYRHLIQSIQNIIDKPCSNFNNIMMELYNTSYKKMGYHSDLAIDLDETSYICIFSCYSNGCSNRKLIIRNKETKQLHEIQMEHNSIILFDMQTNRNYQHKIILDSNSHSEDMWLGLTMRVSKTFIEYRNGMYFVKTNNKLELADVEKRRDFLRYRAQENKTNTFTYPFLTYTLSPSDILMPITK